MKPINAIMIIFLIFSTSQALGAGVNFSLIPDIAMVDRSERVEGFILGIWSENPQSAFALGIVNGSTGDSTGFSLALAANYAENYKGAHLAFVNWTHGHFTGLQFGFGNYAKRLTGVQIGFVNYAASVDNGVQVGLVNIMPENPWFDRFPRSLSPIFPFFNWHFD